MNKKKSTTFYRIYKPTIILFSILILIFVLYSLNSIKKNIPPDVRIGNEEEIFIPSDIKEINYKNIQQDSRNEEYDFINDFNKIDESYLTSKDRLKKVADQVVVEMKIMLAAEKNNTTDIPLEVMGLYNDLSDNELSELQTIISESLGWEEKNEQQLYSFGLKFKTFFFQLINKKGLNEFINENNYSLASLHLRAIYAKEFALSCFITWKTKEKHISEMFLDLDQYFREANVFLPEELDQYTKALSAIEAGNKYIVLNGTEEKIDENYMKSLLGLTEIAEDNAKNYKTMIDGVIEEYKNENHIY